MKCANCGAEMSGANCSMCHKPMDCDGKQCSCKPCSNTIEEKDAKCDACLAMSL